MKCLEEISTKCPSFGKMVTKNNIFVFTCCEQLLTSLGKDGNIEPRKRGHQKTSRKLGTVQNTKLFCTVMTIQFPKLLSFNHCIFLFKVAQFNKIILAKKLINYVQQNVIKQAQLVPHFLNHLNLSSPLLFRSPKKIDVPVFDVTVLKMLPATYFL